MNHNLFCRLTSQINPTQLNKPFLFDEQRKTISFTQMFHQSAQMANALTALGLLKGERLVCCVEKSVVALTLYFACLRVGIIFVPINPGCSRDEVQYYLDNTTASLFICSNENAYRLEQDHSCTTLPLTSEQTSSPQIELNGEKYGSLEQISANLPTTHAPSVMNKDDIAAILYTSGTTGIPKGAMLTHHNLYVNAQALIESWEITGNDTLLHALPIFHTHGLFVAIHVMLAVGANMIFLKNFDVDKVLGGLQHCTIFMGVPTFYNRMTQHPSLNQKIVSKVRLFISGSAPLAQNTMQKFHQITHRRIIQRYGMTEANMITGMCYDDQYRGDRVDSVGKALNGVTIRLNRQSSGTNFGDNKKNTIGEIQVKGTSIFSGYWENHAKTKDAFTNSGFFKTGDLGYIDDDGYLYLVGRISDMIITGGLNVYPVEIETQLNEIEGILESAVVGLPHPDYGEGVTAFITINKNLEGISISESSLIQILKQRLSPYKCPKRIINLSSIPKNQMGKVQKSILRQLNQNLYL